MKEIFGGRFGKADCVLIEEFLNGEEMSYFIISDGENINFSKQHKIIKELVKMILAKILGVWVHIRLQDFTQMI